MRDIFIWLINSIFYSMMLWGKKDYSWTFFTGKVDIIRFSAIPLGMFYSALVMFFAWWLFICPYDKD